MDNEIKVLLEFERKDDPGNKIQINYKLINGYPDVGIRADFVFKIPSKIVEIIQDELNKFRYIEGVTQDDIKQFEQNVFTQVNQIAESLDVILLKEHCAGYVSEEEDFPNSQKWEKFCSTGLLAFVNQFLHIFGWEIILNIDTKSSKIIDAYPQRIHDRRGFCRQTTEQAYESVAKYMKDNATELIKEARSSRITIDTKN